MKFCFCNFQLTSEELIVTPAAMWKFYFKQVRIRKQVENNKIFQCPCFRVLNTCLFVIQNVGKDLFFAVREMCQMRRYFDFS